MNMVLARRLRQAGVRALPHMKVWTLQKVADGTAYMDPEGMQMTAAADGCWQAAARPKVDGNMAFAALKISD